MKMRKKISKNDKGKNKNDGSQQYANFRGEYVFLHLLFPILSIHVLYEKIQYIIRNQFKCNTK